MGMTALPLMSILGILNATSELASEPQSVPFAPAQAQPQTFPNPPGHREIRPTSKVSTISLGARQWSMEKEPGLALEEQQAEESSAGMLADFKVFTDATIAVLMQDPPPWPHSV
jgi:hypothetical protein